MIDRKSRYRSTPTLSVTDDLGVEHTLLDLREVPETTGVYRLTPTDADRLTCWPPGISRTPSNSGGSATPATTWTPST